MTVTTICIIAICVAAVLGAVIGIFKKATGQTFWGVCVLLSVLITWLLAEKVLEHNDAYAWLILGITVGEAVLFSLLFGWFKKFLEKRIENAKEYSHYKNKDKLDENEEYILNAVDGKNKKQYRKLRRKRRKIKDSSKGWGFVNRLLGFIVGGVNWLIAVGSIMSAALIFIDISSISVLKDSDIVKELLASPAWVDLGAKLALDIMLVGTVIIVVKSGFKKGISNLITKLIVLSMLAGFGYTSWLIASSSACEGIVSSIKGGILSSLSTVESLEGISTIIAQAIIAGVIFLLSLIIVIITGIMLPKLINKFRENSDVFYVADGVIGAIVSTALLLAVFMALGGIAYTLSDLSFMSSFNPYELNSSFSGVFYQYNPLGDIFAKLPIRGWFGS